jgi:hypothetical protein
MVKAEAERKRLATVKRRKVNRQKLTSQAGRTPQRLKVHKHFDYEVDPAGQLQCNRGIDHIQSKSFPGDLYLLGTNASAEQIPGSGVVAHYKTLQEVEDAFCHLKSYLRVHPVHHRRHATMREYASCQAGPAMAAKYQTIEVHNLLGQLQGLRLERLELEGETFKAIVTQVPEHLSDTLAKLDSVRLFAKPTLGWRVSCGK